MAKNWLKKITDTMIDIKLEDSLKLKVATRLMDKSAATWWDNLKLCTSIPITWELFVRLHSFSSGSKMVRFFQT